MLSSFKEEVQRILKTQAKIANNIGMTPNKISLIGITLAVFSSFSYLKWQSNNFYLLLAPVLLLISGFCDVLDGALARTYNKVTIFGGFLDSLLDRYSEVFVLIGIIVSGLCVVIWGLIAVVGSLLVSYSRARAEITGVKMESIGLAERAERILILTIFSFVAYFYQPKTTMNVGIIIIAILSHITVLQRTWHIYNKLK